MLSTMIPNISVGSREIGTVPSLSDFGNIDHTSYYEGRFGLNSSYVTFHSILLKI